MPTLPLYAPNPGYPDASHAVIAPGGYERWYFDAESAAGDLRIVAVFSQGTADHPDHSTYLRRLHHYRLGPTRRPPPVPAEWSAVSLTIYEAGVEPLSLVRACAAGEFRAAQDRLDVSAGPDRVDAGPDGGLCVAFGSAGTELIFRPLFAFGSPEIVLFPRHVRARHHWMLPAPYCAVEGTVRVRNGRTVAFSGSGYHDHHFGTEPVGPWMRGRVLGQGRVTAFQVRGGGAPPDAPREYAGEAHFVEADSDGIRDAATPLKVQWTHLPSSIEFEATGMTLSQPRILDRSGAVKRIRYEVTAPTGSGLDGCTALCERK